MPVNARSSPILPWRIRSRVASQRGWRRTIAASQMTTPVRSRTASSRRACSASSAMGFSHKTCLPASAARSDQGT